MEPTTVLAHDTGTPLVVEADLASHVRARLEVGHTAAHHRELWVGEYDGQRHRTPAGPYVGIAGGVQSGNSPFVRGLMQQRNIIVGVTRYEHRQVGNLQGGTVEARHAALIQWNG